MSNSSWYKANADPEDLRQAEAHSNELLNFFADNDWTPPEAINAMTITIASVVRMLSDNASDVDVICDVIRNNMRVAEYIGDKTRKDN